MQACRQVEKTVPIHVIGADQNQVTAVKVSASELAAFTNPPTVYAVVAVDDLRQLLPPVVAERIKVSPGRDIEASAVKVRLTLDLQEVVVNADFELRLPTEQTSVTGTAEVHCSASIERGSIVLRPSGSSLRLSSLKYKGSIAPPLFTRAISAALRAFLANVNGALGAQRVPLRVHATKTIDLAETLRQTAGVTSCTGSTVTAGVAIGSSAVLIDPRAIRVLGSAVFLTPRGFVTSFQLLEARVKPKRSDPLTSEELAALAACVDPVELSGAMKVSDVASVKRVCEEAEKEIASIKTEHFATASEAYKALATSYQTYSEGFMRRAQNVEPGNRVFADSTLIALSRSALAKDIREVLAGANASATYTQSIPPQSFNELITPTTTDLKCTENAVGCESDFSYPPFMPEGCDSNCSGTTRQCVWGICVDLPWADPACAVRKGACEAWNVIAKQGYEVAKSAAQAAWSARKGACELQKAASKAGCQLNQGWLDKWASKEIARVEGSAAVPDLRLFTAIDAVTLAPDASSLTVQYRLRAEARVSATAKVTPLNGGHLICVMPATLSLNATGQRRSADQNYHRGPTTGLA